MGLKMNFHTMRMAMNSARPRNPAKRSGLAGGTTYSNMAYIAMAHRMARAIVGEVRSPGSDETKIVKIALFLREELDLPDYGCSE